MKTFFISSTFKDMHAERDALHQEVFPALRKKIKPYGKDVDLSYYMSSAARSLEATASLAEIEAYIQKLQEENKD